MKFAISRRGHMLSVLDELAIVRRILDAHHAGESYAGIATALNAAGLPTKCEKIPELTLAEVFLAAVVGVTHHQDSRW